MGQGFNIKAKASSADIFIYEDVGELFGGVTAKQFAADLKSAGSVSVINLHISSLGGDVPDGLAIHRQLVEHPAKVTSFVDGWAASIASVIAMAGEKIKISEAGAIMIHNAFGLTLGDEQDHLERAAILGAHTGSIANVYAGRTGNKVDKIRAWMAEEKWFYGKDAVANGFADEVMENLKVAAHFEVSKHKFKHTPAALSTRPLYDAAASEVARMRAAIDRNRVRQAAA